MIFGRAALTSGGQCLLFSRCQHAINASHLAWLPRVWPPYRGYCQRWRHSSPLWRETWAPPSRSRSGVRCSPSIQGAWGTGGAWHSWWGGGPPQPTGPGTSGMLPSASSCLLPSSSSSSYSFSCSSSSYTSRALKEKLETTGALQKCPVCQIGQVVTETSNKECITVYGWRGMREVESINYRCNNRNLAAPCRAGIYPGYLTVSGHVVFKNDALHHEVLLIWEQMGFYIEYLVNLANTVQLPSATF